MNPTSSTQTKTSTVRTEKLHFHSNLFISYCYRLSHMEIAQIIGFKMAFPQIIFAITVEALNKWQTRYKDHLNKRSSRHVSLLMSISQCLIICSLYQNRVCGKPSTFPPKLL